MKQDQTEWKETNYKPKHSKRYWNKQERKEVKKELQNILRLYCNQFAI